MPVVGHQTLFVNEPPETVYTVYTVITGNIDEYT
jgi:hypothetical protein